MSLLAHHLESLKDIEDKYDEQIVIHNIFYLIFINTVENETLFIFIYLIQFTFNNQIYCYYFQTISEVNAANFVSKFVSNF